MSDEESKTPTKTVREEPVQTKITAEETTAKPKDPKKVAQGKRLAQISKAAKEKKMREKIAQESKLFDFSVNYNSLLYLGLPIIVFAGFYAYSAHKNNNVKIVHSPAKKSPEKKTPDHTNKNHGRFVSLFD